MLLPLVALACVSLLALLFGARLGARLSRRRRNLALAVAVGLMVGFMHWLADSVWLAAILPAHVAPVLGSWVLPLGALAAGLVWATKVPRWRRVIACAVLLATCAYAGLGSLVGAPPACFDTWRDGVCRQTTPISCGPAAAATLLAAHGVPASEAELAALCLSTVRGTTFLGLARGLALKAGPDWEVAPITGAEGLEPPALIEMRLDDASDPRFEEEWGWIPGVPHVVVLFGWDGEKPLIGDPATGLEHWDREGFDQLWTGRGLRLRRP